jgi:transcriptional regulator with XRE-family HTH domain
MVKVGKNLRRLREAEGWSMQELADRAGIAKMQVARFEWDSKDPSLESAVKLARALGCSLDELAGLRRPD